MKQLIQLGLLNSRQQVLESWTIEQGAVALACIQAGVVVGILWTRYTIRGQLEDLRILHCFKSAYQFDRSTMFQKEFIEWRKAYRESGLPGKVFLAGIIDEFLSAFPMRLHLKMSGIGWVQAKLLKHSSLYRL